jgi:phosphosulfolactate synthase
VINLTDEKHSCYDFLEFPLAGRNIKPRETGLTMVIDKGLGYTETEELLELASEYIDFIKLGFGTSALYSAHLLRRKIELVKDYDVHIFPGGTFLEIAVMQGKLKDYLRITKELGYTAVEVSDGTINMSPHVREEAIKRALDMGLIVLSEVGKKDERDHVEFMRFGELIAKDLEDGAYKVIVEGRESGKGVVIYDQKGEIKRDELEFLKGVIEDYNDILWEAPLKQQQYELILNFGPNVNLGNIQASEVLAVEALRRGLRGDTLRSCINKGEDGKRLGG